MKKDNRTNHVLRHAANASILALLVLIGVLLMSMFTLTPPYPPYEITLFALSPFFAASLAVGVAAFYLIRADAPGAAAVAALFALMGLLSFGPHKYFDPVFSRIWPALVTADIAIVLILAWCGSCYLGARDRSRGDAA